MRVEEDSRVLELDQLEGFVLLRSSRQRKRPGAKGGGEEVQEDAQGKHAVPEAGVTRPHRAQQDKASTARRVARVDTKRAVSSMWDVPVGAPDTGAVMVQKEIITKSWVVHP